MHVRSVPYPTSALQGNEEKEEENNNKKNIHI
jgi:hypothetical protein